MKTILTVQNEDLERLKSKGISVEFFRELLWAEASAFGISSNKIKVPSAITVPDGGIDAEVIDVQEEVGQGMIKKGLTRYQIKTWRF